MALSRERIADELLKLLALPDPAPTVALMIEHGIFRPVLPEIDLAERLEALIAAEHAAGVGPEAIRRLAALLPTDPAIAESVAARLRLSKRLAKRLASAAETHVEAPERLAYLDRLDRGDRPASPGREFRTSRRWKAGSGRACRSAAAIWSRAG